MVGHSDAASYDPGDLHRGRVRDACRIIDLISPHSALPIRSRRTKDRPGGHSTTLVHRLADHPAGEELGTALNFYQRLDPCPDKPSSIPAST